ncbi:hypothetical protein M427DRAFT_32298 [Gonapodya prolifera JEL478]|uniref:Uncharacterized protein n=1 Tax=Gonapodya prolifera (strain JEL478) TaxID=1344416 RepID=A0A139AFT0_GONPJ|nr:hypothetical protein M427DRAFT_32298 [Gonapodya prolifera JEL478]|eukprot:KXS15618.1 hypothetical protein M427DRAFT_32298 [Gonapodya prolifera JEL478]
MVIFDLLRAAKKAGAFDDVTKLSQKFDDLRKKFGFSKQAKEARELATELQQKLEYAEKVALDVDEGELSGPNDGVDKEDAIDMNEVVREAEPGHAMVLSDQEP